MHICIRRRRDNFIHKRMTISIDESVYDGLVRIIGRRKISQFLEDLARPHVVKNDLDSGYRAMAKDKNRELEASQWCDSLIGDIANESR